MLLPTLSRLSLLPLLFMAAAAHPASDQAGNLRGTWRNPDGTVEVRIDSCGEHLCGTVTGAKPEALADAKDSGYPNLLGMQLMRNYRAEGPRRWSGTVFVPDLNHSFSSHIELIDPSHAKIAGCLWHQFFCKSQVWQRL